MSKIAIIKNHSWPNGKHWSLHACKVCGAKDYLRPKYAPPYCWPCYEVAMAKAAEIKTKFIAEMTTEYGPPSIPERDPTNPFAPR